MKSMKWYKRLAATALAGCMTLGLLIPTVQPMKVQAQSGGKVTWEEVQKIISRYYGEWTDQKYEGAITPRIPHTALLGNGDMGVTSYGAEGEKTFLISKGDFWNYNAGAITIGGVTVKEAADPGMPSAENLAAKVIRAWSSSNHSEFPADRTTSGYQKGMEGWVSETMGSTNNESPWIAYEFEEAVTIGEWIVVGDGGSRGPQEAGNNPSDFLVQVSADGENWTTADSVTGNTEGIIDHILVNPVTTRYLRFYFTKPQQGDNGNDTRGRVAQVFLYEDNSGAAGVDKGTNVAQGYEEIKGSSQHESYGPNRAIDGDFVYGNEGWVTAVDSTPWMAIKYGTPITFSYYELLGDGAIRDNGEARNNPKAFKVQVSDDDTVWDNPADDSKWTTVDEVTDNSQGVIKRTLNQAATGKYVRFFFDIPTQASDDDSRNNPRARVGRIELYNSEVPVSVNGDGSGVYEGSAPGFGSDGPFHEVMNLDSADVDTSIYFSDAPVEINTWTAEKNLLISQLTSTADRDLKLEISTWVKADDAKYSTAVKEENGQHYVTRQSQKRNTGEAKSFVSEAALTTRVIGAAVENKKTSTSGSAEQYVTLPSGGTIYVVTAVGGGGQTYKASDMSLIGDDPVAETEALANSVADENAIKALRAEHDAWWQDFWTRSYIDFGTSDATLNQIQSYYYGALYLVGSGLRSDGLASGLYGNWFTTDEPTWKGDYHLNYNFIAAYYGLNASNHSDLTLPAGKALLDYQEEALRRGQSTEQLRRIVPDVFEDMVIAPKIAAGKIDGNNGIKGAAIFPVGIGPFGMTCDDNYHNEGMNGAYSAYPMMEYYDYTQDKSYLENGLYDFLKSSASFYEVWLEREDTEDGSYVYSLYAGYNEGSWSKNPAVELATIKNLLSHLIEYSEILGRDADRREVWKDILTHLPKQPTAMASGGESLALAEMEAKKQGNTFVDEWALLASPIPEDGNAIPLDAVLPGNIFNHYSSPEDSELVLNTIKTFVNNGNPWGQQNNFPRIFPEAVEMGYDIKEIVSAFAQQLNQRLQKNLTIDDGAHGFEKVGSIEMVNQMMLNSECGMIDVFPNWLSNKDAEYKSLAAKGGFTVSAGYDGIQQSVSHVEITSELGNDCSIVNPWDNLIVTDENGNKVKFTEGKIPYYRQIETDGAANGYHNGTLITFATEKGKTYTLSRVYVDEEMEQAKAELKAMIAEAESALADKTPEDEFYNEAANKALQDVIDTAKAVLENEASSYKELKAQVEVLKGAMDTFDIAYHQWVRALEDPKFGGAAPQFAEYDGCKVIQWTKGKTGSFSYPTNSIAEILAIPSGTVVKNIKFDVSYFWEYEGNNNGDWIWFDTYDKDGKSAPPVTNPNGNPDHGFGVMRDYGMEWGAWKTLTVERQDQQLGGKAEYDWRFHVGGFGNSDSLKIRGYEITVTLEDGSVKTVIWGTMDGQKPDIEKVAGLGDIEAAYGTLASELVLPKTVKVTLNNGIRVELDVAWKLDNYDPETAGTYKLTGTLDTGDAYRNSQNLMAEVNVTVKEDDSEEDDGGNEPGDGDNEPGDDGNKPGDGDNEPGDGDNEPGDDGNKPGDGDNEPGDDGNKPGDGDNKPGDGGEEDGKPADSKILVDTEAAQVKVDTKGLDLNKIAAALGIDLSGTNARLVVQQNRQVDAGAEKLLKERIIKASQKFLKMYDISMWLHMEGKEAIEITEDFGSLTISLAAGREYAGKLVTVYQLHEDGEVIIYKDLKVDENGMVTITVTKLSSFAIALQEGAGGSNAGQNAITSARTGDTFHAGLWTALVLAAGAALLVLAECKKKYEKK